MDDKILFATSVRILRQTKLVWLFSLLSAIGSLSFRLDKSLILLSCFLSLIFFYFLIIGELGIALTLYHGYLGHSVRLKEIWTEINSYIFRWIGLLIIVVVVTGIPIIILVLISNRLPFILSQLVNTFPIYYFITFYSVCLQFSMFSNKLDTAQTLKLAMRAWSSNTRLKLIIASLYSLATIIFRSLLIIIQKGLSINTFMMSPTDYQIISGLPISNILAAIFEFAILPIVTVAIMLVYLKSIDENANAQNISR